MNIKWLHVESSSRCNAWCPACPRNKNGFGLANDLIEQDLSSLKFQEVIESLPELEVVQFCGNLGDPVIGKNFLELINIAKKQVKKIQIHTNGSLRSTSWWQNLALQLSDIDHDIWFGLDGIDEIHEIYRQGTSYKKIIKNANAFISAGGYATWQFIPYAHNEHQIRDCMKLSQQLGFKKFKLVKLYRNKKLARNYKTGEEFDLLPPLSVQSMLRMPKDYTSVNEDNCMHLTPPSLYLAASGKLSTCCYFYKTKSVDTVDEMSYNKLDLSHNICLTNCGS